MSGHHMLLSYFKHLVSKEELSCLYALGQSLMLNKPGDIIKTKLNEDEYLYKIKSIGYN
ncbi:MAG: hypothetical protein ACREV6_17230 [Clostridium sp.]|uniref:hypothetical protein n=1 Tax=Clostridium sp. TaxID=1506 RepID=UPI003D6D7A69